MDGPFEFWDVSWHRYDDLIAAFAHIGVQNYDPTANEANRLDPTT